MSRGPLKQLVIQNLRGSVTPFSVPFERAKKLTIVYGENGSGKSTLCDAFDFIGNGKVGSLEGKGLGSASRFWPSVGMAYSDILVKLETAEGWCVAQCPRSTSVVAQPKELQPRVEVLRRSQILRLIEAAPGERYEAVRRFVDVTAAESSEGTLRELIRGLESSRDTAAARVQENRETLLNFWEADGRPGDDPYGWAAAEVEKPAGLYDAELKALRDLQAAFSVLSTFPDRIKPIESALLNLKEKEATERQAVANCLAEIGADAGGLLALLQAAHPLLQEHPDLQECPLCGSEEKAQGLAASVEQRISGLDRLQKAQKALQETQTQIARQETTSAALRRDSLTNAEDFQRIVDSREWSADVPMPPEPVPNDADSLEAWIAISKTLAVAWQAAETQRQDKKQFVSSLKRAFETLRENFSHEKELDVLLPRLKATLQIVEAERRAFADAILKSIAGEVGRLYEAVHPGEGLNKISLLLDPHRRASLDIGADFQGQAGKPPQAYFSESHLDTLGLCVFLAMAALESPEETILILDDVLASVDEPHVERLIEMLYEEVPRFRHCVITTHYRPWRQKFRWGWLQNGQCQFVELRRWQANEGIKTVRSTPDVTRLHTLLAEDPPDPQLVCAKAGVVLEAVLDFLTQLYECSVPRRAEQHYTLGELLPAIDRRLRAALRVEILEGTDENGNLLYRNVPLVDIMEELMRISQARNVFGCHFNSIAFELLEDDAVRFGQLVAALVAALTDPEEGWPKNGKSGTYWATKGETRRLHPFKKPG